LLPRNPQFVALEGSHLVADAARSRYSPDGGSPSIGHVTSSGMDSARFASRLG